jgi:hypothetical protein
MKKKRNDSKLSPEDQQVIHEWLNLDDEASGLSREERKNLMIYAQFERFVMDSICDNVDNLMNDFGYTEGAKYVPGKTAVRRKRWLDP